MSRGSNQRTSNPRLNLSMGPSRNNTSGGGGSRLGGIGNIRGDDLASQRYVLTEPDDILPLSASKKIYPDFFPWKKSKEEDALAVEHVQKGYQEPPIVTSECSSERVTMVPLFKQWTSLPALQYFLFRSLEVREKNCLISTNSTFKPPPRVTLTDQKRETWLRDLANSQVPLRRLSRTIPHGIRGRALLDQCCSKTIPISRAVWFIRCVGSNELRGLKRRGNNQSNMTEAGWLHDWTEEVVEYIERIVKDIAKIEVSAWRLKLEYMTRLLAHLYHEELVDHGQVLRWCLRYFQKCKPDEVPVALVLVKMFWLNFTASRVLSQALAHALLIQYSNINNLEGDVFKTILQAIGEAMNKLFEVSSDSFVIPKHWRTLSAVLTQAINDTPHAQEMLQMVRIRNESLIVSDAPLVRAYRNHRAVIVKELNKMNAPFNFVNFVKTLTPWKLEDEEVLSLIFEWASTRDRPGHDKVFTAVALCKYLSGQGWNISYALVKFLTSLRDVSPYCMENIHDLVYEFTQAGLLDLGHYFRVSIASGLLFIERLRDTVQGQIEILQNLYLEGKLGDYKIHRDMLLRGIKSLDDSEDEKYQQAQQLLTEICSFMFESQSTIDDQGAYYDLTPEMVSTLQALKKKSKVKLCQWLLKNERSLTVSQFAILQRVLLVLRGFKELYNVIYRLIPKVESGLLLYFLANTVKDQLQVFTTIGDTSEMVQLFITQYKSLKVETKMSKGLYDLVQFTLNELDNKPEARQELEMMIKPSSVAGSAAAASPLDISKMSPMSEIQTDGSTNCNTSNEIGELLRIDLGIGSDPIDVKSMPRVFEATSVKFLEACKEKSGEDLCRKLVRVMQHLRDTELRSFNDLLVKWLRDQVEPDLYYDRNSFLRVLLFLVIYECLSFDKIADIFMQLKSVRQPGSTISIRLMIDLISCEKIDNVTLKASEKLSLDFQRRTFEKYHGKVYLKYVAQQIMETSEGDLLDWVNDTVSQFLLSESTKDLDNFIRVMVDPIFESPQNLKAIQTLKQVVGKLVRANFTNISPVDDILSIIRVVNVFSLPLCQVAMRVYLKSLMTVPMQRDILESAVSPQAPSAQSNNDVYTERQVVEFVVECALKLQSLGLSKQVMGDLMIYLDKSVKGQILLQVELTFLQSATFPRVDYENTNAASTLFEVVDAIADSAMENLCAHYSADIVRCLDKLVKLCEQTGQNDEDNDVEMTNTDDIKDALVLFVKIAMIHCQTFTPDMLQLRDKLVNGLMMLLETSIVGSSTDLTGLLVDSLNTFRGEISDGQVSTPAITNTSTNTTGQTPKLTNVTTPHAATSGSQQVRGSPKTQANANSGIKNASNPASSLPTQHSESSYLNGLMVYDRSNETYSDVAVRSFDLLEDANPVMGLNDVPLNLAMFDCTIEKCNPT